MPKLKHDRRDGRDCFFVRAAVDGKDCKIFLTTSQRDQAEKIFPFVANLIAARKTGASPTVETQNWVKQLPVDGSLLQRLKKLGLLDSMPKWSQTDVDSCLESVRAAYYRERAHRKALEEKIGNLKSLASIPSPEAEFPPIPSTPSISPTMDGSGLPEESGIYFVWDENGRLAYVGQSIKLSQRARLGHSRIIHSSRLTWLVLPVDVLRFAECYYIGIGKPYANFR